MTLPLPLRALALAEAKVTNDPPVGSGILGPGVHVSLLLGGATRVLRASACAPWCGVRAEGQQMEPEAYTPL